jgi:hypothetical protein
VAEVNRHFNAYAVEFPEWEGLRQVFRAYVLAVWLRKHDPAMGRRLMAQLPPPRPPDRPLPSVWPDPQILVVQVAGGQDGVELGQMTICGGVGFERGLLSATPGAAGGSMGSLSSFPSGVGFSPNPIDDSPATPEGYAKWRIALQRERGYLWGWASACLAPGELLTFFGLALALAVFAFWQERRKEHATFNGIQASAIAVDTAATTLVFILTALHPDLYKNHTAPFTAWWGAVLIYTIGFIKGGRLGRLGMFGVVMFIVLVWTLFTPGIGEMWRGFLPLHLALPALGPGWGEPLPTDVIYTLQALRDGLHLGKSAEPRYALYLILIVLVALGFWLETRLESKQSAPSPGS